MIVSEKRFKKVNVQRPAVAISLGEQIRLGKCKPMQLANLPNSEDVEINPLRNANNMTRLSAAVTAYDRLAERQSEPESTPKPIPEPAPEPASESVTPKE